MLSIVRCTGGKEIYPLVRPGCDPHAQDERPGLVFALELRLRDLKCNSAEESPDLRGEFEALRTAKAKETNNAAFLLGIRRRFHKYSYI